MRSSSFVLSGSSRFSGARGHRLRLHPIFQTTGMFKWPFNLTNDNPPTTKVLCIAEQDKLQPGSPPQLPGRDEPWDTAKSGAPHLSSRRHPLPQGLTALLSLIHRASQTHSQTSTRSPSGSCPQPKSTSTTSSSSCRRNSEFKE
jgi:hypothetical protein